MSLSDVLPLIYDDAWDLDDENSDEFDSYASDVENETSAIPCIHLHTPGPWIQGGGLGCKIQGVAKVLRT